jgi:integrase
VEKTARLVSVSNSNRSATARCLCAGLRREELATLLRNQMQQRDGRWCLVNLVEKGGRVWTVAILDWTQHAVAVWLEAMPIKERPVLGKPNKGRFAGAARADSAANHFAIINTANVPFIWMAA